MLGVGWPELMVIAVVTVLVVGPKELPRVLRTVTQLMRRAREMAADFQSGMDQLARESDLDDLRKEAQKLEKSTTDMTTQLDQNLDGDNAIAGMFTGSVVSTPTAGQRNQLLDKPAESDVRVAGMTPATGPIPIETSAPAASNVVPAPTPKKDVAEAEPASFEQRRAGGA